MVGASACGASSRYRQQIRSTYGQSTASLWRIVPMRKLIVLEMMTLDGVIQAPGSPAEDTSGNFAFGGWEMTCSDEMLSRIIYRQFDHPFDLLLGRKTFEIWAAYWPHHADNVIGQRFKAATKYVASTTLTHADWQETVILKGDVVEAVKKLKAQDGPEIQVYGSADFAQTLLQHDLIDELWLRVYPLTLGTGKRFFANGTIPAAFAVAEAQTTPSGVISVMLRRAGEVKTGAVPM
jgi:dihydrofolate reductase